VNPYLRNITKFFKHRAKKTNEIETVAPKRFEPVFSA